jgi:hypothetical protein
MRRIVYASKAVSDFADEDLLALLRTARQRNRDHAVTGMLVYTRGSFLQVIEGRAGDVETIWGHVQRDNRHGEVRVLQDGDVWERSFASWNMGFWHPESDLLERDLPGYAVGRDVPFVSTELIPNVDAALRLLSLYAPRSA